MCLVQSGVYSIVTPLHRAVKYALKLVICTGRVVGPFGLVNKMELIPHGNIASVWTTIVGIVRGAPLHRLARHGLSAGRTIVKGLDGL